MSADLVLELRSVSKTFGSTRALNEVSLELAAGEVHVLAGENGAGKSTLIRILAGVYADYSGELRIGGRAARFASPDAARRAGIATVHQELSLLPNLSVTDNLLLGAAPGPFTPVRRQPARAEALRVLESVGLNLYPETLVEDLTLSERQLLEIGRGLAGSARVLVLDEPTSALSKPETMTLFDRIEQIRRSGLGVLYISHRLEEIYRLADRITVLRDGVRLFTRPARELPERELVRAMVGRELSEHPVRHAPSRSPARPRLRVRALADDGRPPLSNVSFEVAAGEIVGLAGQRGSGAARTLYAVCGASSSARGDMSLDGTRFAPKDVRAAVKRGVLLLPSDRRSSVFFESSVTHNATLSSLRRFSRAWLVDRAREQRAVAQKIPELSLKASSPSADAASLSGGNQQKLALLRCLLAEPTLLLLDDPTRGIDVGAREDVYAVLEALAKQGVGMLLYSSDLDELCRLCDRVLVFVAGSITTTLSQGELDRERLLARVMGGPA